MNVAKQDLALCRKVAVETAEAAGRVITEEFGVSFGVTPKGTAGDVVTSLDQNAERLIISRLQEAFPTHRILSEEMGAVNPSAGAWTWLVDPLDGSNNIVIGLPVVAIGLTLCYQSQPLVGVVHEPFLSRTWSAVCGDSAWQAGDRPLLRRSRDGRPPVIAWTQGYGIAAGDHTVGALRAGLGKYARRVLELWAPLCSWAMLARGDIDGIVGYRIGELDLHAGALIAAATGIEIRELGGQPFEARFCGLAENRSLVAAIPERMPELLELVRAYSPVRG